LEENIDLLNFTGEMMDYLNEIDGKFYLAYNIEGHTDKIKTMYPDLSKLFELKSKYDSDNMFDNKFFQQF
jgi:collagenase-like PrtC family protease